MAIWFHSEKYSAIKIFRKRELKIWISSVLSFYKKKPGEINFIYLSDEELLEINKDFLNHNFYTDVITFDYSVGTKVSGDIYLSVDRIYENSIIHETDFAKECLRVMIHGVLHLIGFKDSSDEEKKQMRLKEELHLQNVKGSLISLK